MNIPIEIIAVVLTIIFGALGALILMLFKVLGSNTTAINNINLYLETLKTSNKYEGKECETTHKYISEKFKKHDAQLDSHEKRLIKIEK